MCVPLEFIGRHLTTTLIFPPLMMILIQNRCYKTGQMMRERVIERERETGKGEYENKKRRGKKKKKKAVSRFYIYIKWLTSKITKTSKTSKQTRVYWKFRDGVNLVLEMALKSSNFEYRIFLISYFMYKCIYQRIIFLFIYLFFLFHTSISVVHVIIIFDLRETCLRDCALKQSLHDNISILIIK